MYNERVQEASQIFPIVRQSTRLKVTHLETDVRYLYLTLISSSRQRNSSSQFMILLNILKQDINILALVF